MAGHTAFKVRNQIESEARLSKLNAYCSDTLLHQDSTTKRFYNLLKQYIYTQLGPNL